MWLYPYLLIDTKGTCSSKSATVVSWVSMMKPWVRVATTVTVDIAGGGGGACNEEDEEEEEEEEEKGSWSS